MIRKKCVADFPLANKRGRLRGDHAPSKKSNGITLRQASQQSSPTQLGRVNRIGNGVAEEPCACLRQELEVFIAPRAFDLESDLMQRFHEQFLDARAGASRVSGALAVEAVLGQ